MKIRELFLKDPLSWRVVNEGVSSNNVTDPDILRYELQTFVCEGEYRGGLEKILQGFLDNLGKQQKAAWVSGFYGSGKSHLVKVLRYLWTDYPLPGNTSARSLATLPGEVSDLFKELSTQGKRGGGLHSAGGTLKAGTGNARLRLLSIILQSAGLPEKLSVARLMMDLRDDDKLPSVQNAIRQAGKDPAEEFGKLYTSKTLQEAYLQANPHLKDLKNVSEALRAQYPTGVTEISIDETIAVIRRALASKGQLPLTVVALDEVQQFINNDANVTLEVQEIVEACSTKLDGKVLFVGTGQSALSDTPALQRLMGRFSIKVHLRDNDVEKVVRTVVLQKKEARKKDIEELVTRQAGEISRQLNNTKIAKRSDDDSAYVADYPLLPVRRRFWEHVLHSVDPTGTTAQMRTQLRVVHEACRAVAERPLGTVIPADFLYEQLANDLVISGEMQKRFQEIIEEQKSKPEGQLRSRICALVFLINKLPQNGADIGVRATAAHLADLLTDDLGQSATVLRQKVPGLVKDLVTEGVLMDIEDEYRLQTSEGAAWEAEFRRRRAALLSNDPQIAAQRGQLLSKAVQDQLDGVSVVQGDAKEKRKVGVHHGMEAPPASEGLVVWVRDGFQESEGSVLQDIQRRSVEDATIHLLIPKSKADELKSAVASLLAAEETLHSMGQPNAQEGKEARSAMVTRQANEGGRLEGLVADVLRGARVFLSGGQELPGGSLRQGVETAAKQVLQRLYPKFGIGDSGNWSTVWKRAKEGNAAALEVLGYSGDPDKHPVAAELLRNIGAGKKGTELVAKFTVPPYGWPKDAIDATLAVLMASGHLGARLQGQAVSLGDLDQRKAGQADYRVQHPVLTPPQKLRIKKLFQDASYPFRPGDEAAVAPGFVQALKKLAAGAGGDSPAPEATVPPVVLELEGLSGNDLLFTLYEKADDLTERIKRWSMTAAQIAKRTPAFKLAGQLVSHASGLEGVESIATSLAAISANRSLLHDPDPVTPLLKQVGTLLRSAVQRAHATYEAVRNAEQAKLEAHPIWKRLTPEKRDTLLRSGGVAIRPAPSVGSEEDILTALEVCSLSEWASHADALPTRFGQVLAAAIKEAEPKAKRITLPPANIRTAEEMEAWLTAARAEIAKALRDGPVIL